MNLKKNLFHKITNINEKSVYSSEIYLEKNSDMLSSNPVRFLVDLIKISFHYGIKDKNNAVKLSGKRESDFTNMYYRHKGVLVFKSLEKYKCIIIDVVDTLFYTVLKKDDIYRIVQMENKVEGFFKERKKFDSTAISINEIYEKINSSLGTNLTPECELRIYEKSILKNTYVSEIVDMLAANNIKTIPVIRGCYTKEFYKKIFEEKKISFSNDIITVGADEKNYGKFLKNLIKKIEKENNIASGECLVYSSDYKNCVKPLRNANYNSSYYYPPKMFYKKYNYPEVEDVQGGIYKNIVSYELFGYKSMKSKEYSAVFAYFAPVVTDILENISELGKRKKIVFAGSSDNLIYRMFKKYYDKTDKAVIIDWSYFMAEYSEDVEIIENKSEWYREKWNDIYEKMPSLKCVSKERIEYLLCSNKENCMINNIKHTKQEEYIKDCMDYEIYKIKHYDKEKSGVLLVDLTEKNSGGVLLLEKLKKLYTDIEFEYYSWINVLREKTVKQTEDDGDFLDSIESIDRIFQRDVPVILKVTSEKISYVYTVISSLTANEKMKGAVKKYIEKHLCVSSENNRAATFSKHDICEILKHGNALFYALGKGGI